MIDILLEVLKWIGIVAGTLVFIFLMALSMAGVGGSDGPPY